MVDTEVSDGMVSFCLVHGFRRYEFSDEEMRKNVLRTHTTAVSSRMLYKLAEQKPFKPMKYFSIDRVFRNETVDSTHLAECKGNSFLLLTN